MMQYETQFLISLISVVILILIAQLTRRGIRKFAKVRSLDPNRKKIILNLFYIVIYIIAALVLAVIWGFQLRDFTVFVSSILAVLGIGFFAQWSILSNLTASVILFFYHPFRIGDRIRVIDKDYDWVGEIKDITGFFVFMKTDKGEDISLPTSLVLQKGIELLRAKNDKEDIEEHF